MKYSEPSRAFLTVQLCKWAAGWNMLMPTTDCRWGGEEEPPRDRLESTSNGLVHSCSFLHIGKLEEIFRSDLTECLQILRSIDQLSALDWAGEGVKCLVYCGDTSKGIGLIIVAGPESILKVGSGKFLLEVIQAFNKQHWWYITHVQ